jgi:hypothetical protein
VLDGAKTARRDLSSEAEEVRRQTERGGQNGKLRAEAPDVADLTQEQVRFLLRPTFPLHMRRRALFDSGERTKSRPIAGQITDKDNQEDNAQQKVQASLCPR